MGRSRVPKSIPGRSKIVSWAAPGHLGRLLAGSWAVLGLLGESSAGPGLLLGVLVGSWTALGLSWAVFGRSWAALERSWAPSWSQDGPQEAQSRPQDPPKLRPRRSKTVLKWRVVFRTVLWELRQNSWDPNFRILGRLGPQVGAKLGLSWDQKSKKIDPEIDQNFDVF